MQISRTCRVRFIPAFVFRCVNFIIVTSCMIDLGIEVEAFREAMCGCSSLGCRVRVGKMCRDRELEIFEILLMVVLGYRPNIQSSWNINAAEFIIFIP